MGKHSSDTDSNDSGRGHRSKYSSSRKGRSRSSSSESSHRRHKKRCKGRRSRSKERYSKSSRRRGANVKSSYKRTSSSDSSSDDSKRKNRRSPISSSSSAANSLSASRVATPDTLQSHSEQMRAKDMRASQAAKIADTLLRQRRGEVVSAVLPVVAPHSGLLDEINNESFVQRAFSSSASAPRASLPDIPLPVVVDLCEEPKRQTSGDLGVMSPALLEDPEGKQQRWIKKLFAIRQKALHGEPMVT